MAMMMSYVGVSTRQIQTTIHTRWSFCDCAATMRRPCALPSCVVRAGGVVVAARAHVMAILVLTDWSLDISRAILGQHTRTGGRVDEASCARQDGSVAGWTGHVTDGGVRW